MRFSSKILRISSKFTPNSQEKIFSDVFKRRNCSGMKKFDYKKIFKPRKNSEKNSDFLEIPIPIPFRNFMKFRSDSDL